MTKTSLLPSLTLGLVTAALAAAPPALAQYDRNGKYVPSPLGQPADPYARPIPQYSGKPGAAIGTPSLPRAYETKPPPPPVLRREPEVITVYPSQLPVRLPVPLTREQCEEGWSVATNIPRVEFNRRCARMKRKQP